MKHKVTVSYMGEVDITKDDALKILVVNGKDLIESEKVLLDLLSFPLGT
jgi:hypothetical protein